MLLDLLFVYVYSAFFMDNKNVGVNQVIALKEEPSFGYPYLKLQYYDTIFIKLFTTCEWQVNLLGINYKI